MGFNRNAVGQGIPRRRIIGQRILRFAQAGPSFVILRIALSQIPEQAGGLFGKRILQRQRCHLTLNGKVTGRHRQHREQFRLGLLPPARLAQRLDQFECAPESADRAALAGQAPSMAW